MGQIEKLAIECAEEAYEQASDPADVSWSFEPMQGDWDALENEYEGVSSSDRQTFADAYRRRLRELVREGQ